MVNKTELSIGSSVNLNGNRYIFLGWGDDGRAIVAGDCRGGITDSDSLPYLGEETTIDRSKLMPLDVPKIEPDVLKAMKNRRNARRLR